MVLNKLIELIAPNKLLKAILVLAVFVILSKLFLFISKKIIRRLTKKTKTDLDDKLIDILEAPVAIILLIIGVKLSISVSELSFKYIYYLINLLNSFIAIASGYVVAYFLSTLIEFWGDRFTKKTKISIDNDLLPLMHKSSKFIIIVVIVLVILNIWGVNIGPMLASLGIAGLAVGLALQSTLSNIFSGISLILDKSFKVGDIIETNNIIGVVYDIGLRSTSIKTFDNDIVTVPNGQLANQTITNRVQPEPKARATISFAVAYGTDVKKVKNVVLEVIRKTKNVVDNPEPLVMFDEMGNSSLNFKAYFWVDKYSHKWRTKEEITCKIYEALNKNKIEIPFPQLDIRMRKK